MPGPMIMTERSLYAWLGALIWWLAASGSLGAQPAGSPCPLCITATIAPGQALLLPADLHGLTILVVDEEAPLDGLARATSEVTKRGGRPGLFVPRLVPENEANLYRMKLRLTELRARLGPGVQIAIEGPVDAELSGYVDVIVGGAGSSARLSRWIPLDAATADEALAATAQGGESQWVVKAPADVLRARTLLEALARAAAPPPEAFTEEVQVRGSRRLTASEIVARHQAYVRRTAERTARSISTGVLTLTFEAPGFPAPITVTSDTVIYTSPVRTEVEQRAIRVNGLSFRGEGVPRLPILEPERAAAPPLAITLGTLYRYTLVGEGEVDGVRCHVIGFEPTTSAASLFRGRAWITMDTFAMARVAATQTRLRGPIVASEQVDEFRVAAGGLWLLARSDVRQTYEGAAHRTPIQRLLTIAAHELNPPDFEARLQAAYRSSSLMLRDTPAGYRYLRREPAAASSAEEPDAVVTRVVETSSRVRTIAAGMIVDPNISAPLPFAGLSYVDFDLFGTGAQLNAFFGGSYGQLAFSIPSLGGSRWQLAGRAFGIASSYNDRSFENGRERYDENLRQRPAHASGWALWPLSPRLTVRAGYELDYTRLRRADETAAAFVVPADQVTHGVRFALEGQRAGWTAAVWWNPARRTGWRAWGIPGGDFRPSHATFQRYGASLARSAAVRPWLVTRIEGSLMAGHDLDRFSRYAFGTFDNRLRGYPSALVRYDRGAVARASAAWAASRFVRLDAFFDTAQVRDRGFTEGYRNYTGVGAALEAPGPFGLLGAVEWGYGFRGVNADGTLGTHVIRVSAYKVF